MDNNEDFNLNDHEVIPRRIRKVSKALKLFRTTGAHNTTRSFINNVRKKRVCIICLQQTIQEKNINSYCVLGPKISKSVLTIYAQRQADSSLMEHLNQNDIIYFHSYCLSKYSEESHNSVYEHDIAEINKNSKELDIVCGLQKVAYLAVYEFVQEEIIDKEQSICLSDLNLQYRTILYTLNENEPLDLDKYNNYKLEEKLLEDFGENLVIERDRITGEKRWLKQGVDIATAALVATNVSWTYQQIKQALSTINDMQEI